MLDKALIDEIQERLGHDRPAVRQAASEVLAQCGLEDFGGIVLLKKGAALMAREREEESMRMQQDFSQVQTLAREAKRRYAEQRESARRGNGYKVDASTWLTVEELKARGECPPLFASAEERKQDKARVDALNAKGYRRIAELAELAEDQDGVRQQISKYMNELSRMSSRQENALIEESDADEQLRATKTRVAIEALVCIAQPGDQRVLEQAVAWLNDSSWGVRCAAVFAIGRISAGDKNASAALLHSLARDMDPSVRAAAASALAALYEQHHSHELSSHGFEFVEAMVRALQDEDVWVRLAAERGLCACVKTVRAAATASSSVAENVAVDGAYDAVITHVAHQLVHSELFVRNAAQEALKGAGILRAPPSPSHQFARDQQAQRRKDDSIVASALAARARDTTASKECRAEACQVLLAQGLWTPALLRAVELHGYRLWKCDLVVRRSAAEALRELASEASISGADHASTTVMGSCAHDDQETANTQGLLVEMLSIGLDDFDLEVRRCSLVGLQAVCRARDRRAGAALSEMLRKESDPENLSRGMLCLMQTDAAMAREVIPSLIGHVDKRVREAARNSMTMLQRDVGLIVQDLLHPEWPKRLECLLRLTSLYARRGPRLLESNLLDDCHKSGFKDGDCVLAVLDRQLGLDWSIEGMRRAAPFVHQDGVKVEDDETWSALESAFTCRIELLDVATMRTMRSSLHEGPLVHIAILNGHALAISHDDVLHLREKQTCKYSWDAEISQALSHLLVDPRLNDNPFVRQAAARALGDVACAGDPIALAALMQAFDAQPNVGLRGVIMSAICKLCTIQNQKVMDFMFSHLESADPEVCLPICVSVTELMLESTPSEYGRNFFAACERLLTEKLDNRGDVVAGAFRWALSRLDQMYCQSKEASEAGRAQARMLALKAKQEERKLRKEKKKAALAAKVRRQTDSALAELVVDVGARRFDALGLLARLDNFDADAMTAVANALYDQVPRVRARAMGLLRRCAKSAVSDVTKALLDVIRRRDTEISTHAVSLLGQIVPRGTQDVIDFLLEQLNIQNVNYLGSGLRRCVWDRIAGFRQATLEALFQIMPSGDSQAFILGLALEDLDSPDEIVRGEAFEVVAQQVSEEKMYNIAVVKMLKMLGANQQDKRLFAVRALQQIARPRDMRLLLALRKVLEDQQQQEETRMVAAQTMVIIDAADFGVQAAIRGVMQQESEASSAALQSSARGDPKCTLAGGAAQPLTCSRLALVLSVLLDRAWPLDAASRLPATVLTDLPEIQGQDAAKGPGGQDKEPDLRLKKIILHVPRSVSKIGRSMDGRQHIRRQLPCPLSAPVRQRENLSSPAAAGGGGALKGVSQRTEAGAGDAQGQGIVSPQSNVE